jgi:hypothetical protein
MENSSRGMDKDAKWSVILERMPNITKMLLGPVP